MRNGTVIDKGRDLGTFVLRFGIEIMRDAREYGSRTRQPE